MTFTRKGRREPGREFQGRARLSAALLTTAVLAIAAGCTHTVKVDPIKVEPIDITLHIYLKADEKLDSFFGDDEPAAPAVPSSAAPSSGMPPTAVSWLAGSDRVLTSTQGVSS